MPWKSHEPGIQELRRAARASTMTRKACDKWTACHNYTAHDLECDCANTGVATINGHETPYEVPE